MEGKFARRSIKWFSDFSAKLFGGGDNDQMCAFAIDILTSDQPTPCCWIPPSISSRSS
jgi:hypothetical protein